MKAIAVHPGQADSMHLREDVEKPRVDDIPDGRGVLVKVLRVGVDGTDKEINAAEYGDAPEGFDYLITGHESLGRVLEVGENVPSHIKPGSIVVATVRLRGIEVACISLRPAPYLNSDLIEELGATYVSTQEMTVAEAAAEHGPFDLVIEATGFSPLVWEGAQALAKNGVLVLVSVTGGDRKVEIPSDAINQAFVLGNKVMVGSVNASPDDFARGRDDLVKAYAFYPGWLEKLLTTPVQGLESYEQMLRELTENKDAIKVFVEVAREGAAVNGAGA